MQRRICVQPRFFALLIAVLILCILVSCIVSEIQYARATDRLNALNAERASLLTRVNDLNAQLEYVRSDAYVERVARDELGMLRPGDIRYVSNK